MTENTETLTDGSAGFFRLWAAEVVTVIEDLFESTINDLIFLYLVEFSKMEFFCFLNFVVFSVIEDP